MLLLTGQATATKYTAAFETTRPGKVWIHVLTTIGTGSVALWRKDMSAASPTWAAFFPDGVAASFTTASSIKMYELPGGMRWRLLNVGNTAGTTCAVDGANINVNVEAAEGA